MSKGCLEVEKRMIISEIKNLNKENKLVILSIIKNYDQSIIYEQKDGCRVDLDKLPSDIIETILNKIKLMLSL